MLNELQLKRYWCYRKKQFKPEQAKAFSIMQTEWYELGGYETDPYSKVDEEESEVRLVVGYDEWAGPAEEDWLNESNWDNKRAFEAYRKEIRRLEENDGYYFIAAEFRNPFTNEWEWAEAVHGFLGYEDTKENMDEFKGYAIDAYKAKLEEYNKAMFSVLNVLV